MAVDIEGFDIVFSAANANHARTIDQSIANMEKNMGSLKQSSAAFAETMERLGRLDISKLAKDMAAIKDAVNGIDKDRLKQVFAAGTTETQNMLTNITEMINKLAQAGGIKIAPVVKPSSAPSSNSQTSNATQVKDDVLSEGKINSLWAERARLMIDVEKLWKKSVSLQQEGKDLSQAEGELLIQKYQRLQGVINQLEKQKTINREVYAKTESGGLIKVKQAEVDLERWAASEKEKAERRKTAIQKEEERKRQQDYKRQAEMWRAANNNKNTTLTGAVDFAGTANTLNRLVTAQKYLKEALASTKPNTPEWQRAADTYKQVTQRINEIKQAMGGLKEQSNSIMPALKNLAIQFGLVFSVQQITQWLKHMVDVRAQFELQQIALRSIIQDKQKADEVFAKVQQLALKSPFSIMQLNTYTKQIAAYGVEADKLVGTTKELADVSAGLGVDMGRLILAFGQVKTANYLRATEVRQFTEAGLNITQELANYFTELNGKMVTAGDVTEMITKRMVKFEDVAEVFHRVTSAGGMFYNMQEKQSEGLYGQMQRIKDAYSIMLNDIGKSNQGQIAAVLSTIREIISSWRSVASFIKVAAMSTAAYIGVAKFAAIVEMLNKTATGYKLVAFATNAATAAQLKNNAAVVANPYALAAAAIALVVAGIYELATATDQLTEDLQRMQQETFADATDSVERFTELADTVRDVTKAYSERKEAMDEIQRSYGDILPMQQLEMDGIMSISDGYKEATEAIREYYRIKLEEEQKSAIESSTASNMQKASSKIVDDYTSALEDIGATKSSIQSILNRIIEQLKEGSITTVEDAGNAFVDELIRYYKITDKELQEKLRDKLILSPTFHGTPKNVFGNIVKEAENYRFAIEGITQSNEYFADITEERTHVALKQINTDFEQVEAKLKNVSMAFSLLDQLRTMNERSGGKGFDIAKIQAAVSDGKTGNLAEEEQKVAAALQEIDKALKDVGLSGTYTWQQIYDATANNFAQMEWFGTVQKTAFTSFLSNLNQAKYQTNELAKAKFAEKLQAKIESVDGTPTVREIKRIVKAVADANKLDYHLFDWLTLDVKTSFESAGKEFDTQLKLFHEKILAYKYMMKIMYVTGQSEQDILKVLGLTKEQIDNSLALEDAYKKIRTAMGNLDNEKKTRKTNKTKTDKTEQTLRERIKLIKEANQTFEKYAKEYDKVIAKEKTHNDLMERAKELKIDEIFAADDLTKTATLDAMQNVYDKFKSLYENKKYVGAKRDALKSMSEVEFEISVEINKESRDKLSKELDKMMGSYQLYVELDKMGIGDDIIKTLFDVDYTSLDDIKAQWEKLYVDIMNKQYKQLDENFEAFKSYEEAKQRVASDTEDGIINANYQLAIDTEKKITDTYKKELESRMKEYAKYLKKSYSESVNEQVNVYRQLRQLQMDAYFKRNAINSNDKLDDNAKQKALQQLDSQSSQIAAKMQEQLQEKLNKIQWDGFKDSPLFETVLSDVENLSTRTIDMLLSKLEELKSTFKDLDPKSIKEITNYIDKLTAQKIENNPFKEWGKALREVHELKKKGLTLDKLNANLISESDELTRINSQIESHNKVLAIRQQMTHVTDKDIDLLQKETKALEQQLQVLESQKKASSGDGSDTDGLDLQIKKIQEILAARMSILASNGKNVVLGQQEIALLKNGSKELTNQILLLASYKGLKEGNIKDINAYIRSWGNLEDAQQKSIAILNEVGNAASAGFSVAQAALDLFGASSDEVTKSMLQGFDDCLQSVISLTVAIVGMEEAANTASGIIGIIAASLTAVASVFKAIFNVHEAKLEKSIKEHQRQVKRLEAEYDNLSDAISNAFSGFQLGTNTQEAIQNLEKQNEQYRAMIENEKEKKDVDEDQIEDWEQTIEDNLKKAEELRQQYFTELGGLGSGSDVRDAAEGFVDAWIEAFGETGDGLSGLKKDFDDFIRNIIKKQAYMKVADHWINKFGDMINAAFDKYGNVDSEKIQQAIQWFTEEGMPQIDSFLEDFNAAWERYGISLTDNTSNLSGLAAGIQGVTEETAQILEALLNSMRYYVADTNEQLRQIFVTMTNPNEENPFLKELKNQTKYLASIDKRLDSVISATKRASGSHINVFAT